MEMEQLIDHSAMETVNGAGLGALIGLADVSPVRAILAGGAAEPDDEGRWTTVAEVTVGQYQYRLIRSNAKKLTRRETEVLERVMRGSSNKVIAFDLGIAHSTVRVLLFRAMLKLGVKKRADLVTLLQDVPARLSATPS